MLSTPDSTPRGSDNHSLIYLRAYAPIFHHIYQGLSEEDKYRVLNNIQQLNEQVHNLFVSLVCKRYSGVKEDSIEPRLFRSEMHEAIVQVYYGDVHVENGDHPLGILREILYMSGNAVPLLDGDWLVDRGPDAHSASLGIISEIHEMREIYQWQRENNVSNETGKNIAQSLGAGNGHNIVTLQQSEDSSTFVNGHSDRATIGQTWDFVGICDRYYFPLVKLLESLLKSDGATHLKFCHFLVTQIQNFIEEGKISSRYFFPGISSFDVRKLGELLLDTNFLQYLQGKIEKRGGYYIYHFDGDYADQSQISSVNLEIIDNYFRDPKGLLDSLFHDVIFSSQVVQFAPFHFRNIYLTDFTSMGEIFPEGEIFDYISSVRGTSHIDNEDYFETIKYSIGKLKPGGVIFDEGVRRSYSREIRLGEVVRAIEETNHAGNICGYVITNPLGDIISIRIEKGVPNSKIPKDFIFRDTHGLGANLRKGMSISKIDETEKNISKKFIHPYQRLVDDVMRRVLKSLRNSQDYYKILKRLGGIITSLERDFRTTNSQNIWEGIRQTRRDIGTILSHIQK